MNRPHVFKAATVVLASLLCAGCTHRLAKKNPAAPAGQQSAFPMEVSDAEPSLQGGLVRSIPELKTVHFDYDSAFLSPEERKVLAANADWLKSHKDVRVQVSGHCDQRGTIDYNLALGQRRAAAVREYYRHLGVPGKRVATISYGKEKPLCQEADEDCWRKNRRAATLAATPTVANSR